MDCSQAKPPKADLVPPGGIAGWSTIETEPGLHEWSGRLRLPAGDSSVEPARKYCLIRHDGRAGEMIVDRFRWSNIDQDVAVLQGNHSAREQDTG